MGRSRTIPTYIRLTPEQRQLLLCLTRALGYSSLSDTIRLLIELGMQQLDMNIRMACRAETTMRDITMPRNVTAVTP